MTIHTINHYLDPAKHLHSITFENDGPRIAATNYWTLPIAKCGLCYLSGNAGHWRPLLPGCLTEAVQEFRSVGRAMIEPSVEIAGHFDIVALDGSEAPYFVTIDKTMIDRAIRKTRCRLFIYTEKSLIANVPLKVRL